jgi:hypothetical protein
VLLSIVVWLQLVPRDEPAFLPPKSYHVNVLAARVHFSHEVSIAGPVFCESFRRLELGGAVLRTHCLLDRVKIAATGVKPVLKRHRDKGCHNHPGLVLGTTTLRTIAPDVTS